MSKVVLKTARRSTTLSRWAVRDAVAGRFVTNSSSKNLRSSSHAKKRAVKVAAKRKK